MPGGEEEDWLPKAVRHLETGKEEEEEGVEVKVPTTYGALTKKEKHEWVQSRIGSDDLAAATAEIPVCPQHLRSQEWDWQAGRWGRRCRNGAMCKRLHVDIKKMHEITERTKAPQRFNLQHVSLYSLSTHPDRVELMRRPPLKKAIDALFHAKFSLPLGKRVPVSSIAIRSTEDKPDYVILYMQDQKEPSSSSLSNAMVQPPAKVTILDKDGN